MTRRLIFASALATALLAATVAHAGGPRFGGYVSCSPAAKKAGSKCSLAAKPTAVFRAFKRRGVAYQVCVKRPSGKVRCRDKETRHKGGRSLAPITLTNPGRYGVTWRVHGKAVLRRKFRARAPRVFVDGDSLAVGTAPYLPHDLPGWPITQSTSISRQVSEGVDILRAQGSSLAGVIFMSLGTNGDPRATDSFAADVRQAVAIAGPHRCVIWANIVRPEVAGASYDGLNGVLSKLNRRYDNLFVVDWAAIASRNRGWFGPDGVHPTATGYQVRAKAIAAKARACLGGPLAK